MKCGQTTVHGRKCKQETFLDLPRCWYHISRVEMEDAVTREGLNQMFGEKQEMHPAEALVQLVHYKAGEVMYWRGKIMELEELGLEILSTEVVKEVDGPMGPTVTTETRPHPWYEMLRVAERDLAAYCSTALRAGVEERQVRIAEAMGGQILEMLETVLAELDLTGTQQSLAAEVVPRVLRSMSTQARAIAQ